MSAPGRITAMTMTAMKGVPAAQPRGPPREEPPVRVAEGGFILLKTHARQSLRWSLVRRSGRQVPSHQRRHDRADLVPSALHGVVSSQNRHNHAGLEE